MRAYRHEHEREYEVDERNRANVGEVYGDELLLGPLGIVIGDGRAAKP